MRDPTSWRYRALSLILRLAAVSGLLFASAGLTSCHALAHAVAHVAHGHHDHGHHGHHYHQPPRRCR